MNEAEKKRDARIAKMRDFDLLRSIVTTPKDEAVTDDEFRRFTDMLEGLKSGEIKCLSRKQRMFAEEVARRITPIDSRDVPRGREVEPPAALRVLPKKPPQRKMRE